MKVYMKLERTTKGAVLYREVDAHGRIIQSADEYAIGNLYIRKSSEIGKAAPQSISVQIEDQA